MASGRNKDQGPIDLLLCEGTRLQAQLLADALQRDHRLHVVDFAADSLEFMELAARYTLGVVVISVDHGESAMDGITTLRVFHEAYPHIPAIVLLDSSHREDVLEAFRCGARGIFSKHGSLEDLCKCVRVVYEGQVWANTQEVDFVLEALAGTKLIRAVSASGMNLLTKREHEVVQHLAEGLSNQEIGVRLSLSRHTIKNYLFRIFDKLGVSNRVELLTLTLRQPGPVYSFLGEGPARDDGNGNFLFAGSRK